MICHVAIVNYPEPCSIITVHGMPIDGTDDVADTNIIEIRPGINDDVITPPVPGVSLNFLIELSTSGVVAGMTAYDEAVNGIPGAPFGAITGGQVNGHDVRELTWARGGGDMELEQFYFAITHGGDLPTPPYFTSLSFMDDDGTVWTLLDADSQNPGGLEAFYGDETIMYWNWNVTIPAGPVVTDGAMYDLIAVE